ncbi:MAG: respiratory nitrate reductase subunit gamma [Chloroflexota bacterium]
MNGLAFFIEGIFPYIAIIIFVLGTAYRLWYWLQTPVPLRIGLAPAKTTWKAATGKIAAEFFLFISLLRSDKVLWVIAWIMHICALVVLVGTHFFGLIDAGIELWTPLVIPQGKAILYVAATFSFPLIATLLILLFKRLFTPEVRRITIPTDYVALGLILFHVVNGTYMSFFTEVDMAEVMKWGLGLATFHPYVVAGSWIFPVHVATAFTLFIYFPFSKLFHPLGQIVNRWTITQKEEPLVPGGAVVK